MKKILGFLAVVALSICLFACGGHKCTLGELHEAVEATCSTNGNVAYYECLECGQKYNENKEKIDTEKVYAHHPLNLLDYFSYGECPVCHETVRMSPISSVEDELYIEENNDLYVNCIDKGKELQELFKAETVTKKMWEAYIDQYDEAYEHLINRYFYINLMYSVYYTEEYKDLKDEISKYETDLHDSLLKTIAAVYDSSKKDDFINLDYFDQEDLDYIEENIDIFRNEELAEIQKKIDELQIYLEDPNNVYKASFLPKYQELIALRNQFAKIEGYDNYYEYGLQSYGREYDKEQVGKVRDYYRQYLSAFMNSKYKESSMSTFRAAGTPGKYYTALFDSVYTNKQAMTTLRDFFKTIKTDDDSINFYKKINDAMKNGYIVNGDLYEGAFSQTNSEPPYMYFQNDAGYSSSSTFVHECGHYNLSVDPVLSDYDLYETHSQGAEQLFTRFILNECEKKRYDAVAKEILLQLEGDWAWTLSINIIADEFEQAVYENTYKGYTQYEDGIVSTEYNALFKVICEKYGVPEYATVFTQLINYYFSDGSVYEISYPVSLIPCISLFFQSADDYDSAVKNYLKTYTYMNDDEFVDDETFENIILYSGLGSPFDEQTYKDIAAKLK